MLSKAFLVSTTIYEVVKARPILLISACKEAETMELSNSGGPSLPLLASKPRELPALAIRWVSGCARKRR